MLALCHDLVPLSKGQIVGRQDEQKAFAAVEATFSVGIPHRMAGHMTCNTTHDRNQLCHNWQGLVVSTQQVECCHRSGMTNYKMLDRNIM